MRQSGSKFRTGLEVSANQPGKNLDFRKWVVPYVYANALYLPRHTEGAHPADLWTHVGAGH